MEALIKTGKYPVWLSDGVLSQSRIDNLIKENIEVSYFDYVIDIDNEESREEALLTIAEHHPKERIWSESRPTIFSYQ